MKSGKLSWPGKKTFATIQIDSIYNLARLQENSAPGHFTNKLTSPALPAAMVPVAIRNVAWSSHGMAWSIQFLGCSPWLQAACLIAPKQQRVSGTTAPTHRCHPPGSLPKLIPPTPQVCHRGATAFVARASSNHRGSFGVRISSQKYLHILIISGEHDATSVIYKQHFRLMVLMPLTVRLLPNG